MNSFARILAAATLALAAGVPTAKADILAFGSYRGVIGVTATERPIPLRQNGTTEITFKTTKANAVVAVTYNAVCYVQSYSIYGGLGKVRTRITIDGIETLPQTGGQESALCAIEHPGTGMGAHSQQGAMRIGAAGTHTLRIYASFVGSAINGALYSSSTMIQN